MANDLGVRPKDLRIFAMVAQKFGVYILVRQTNVSSLQYIGLPHYYPKPLLIKAKTADKDVAQTDVRVIPSIYQVAGLVVHPGFQPRAFNSEKQAKAMKYWNETLEVLAPILIGKPVNLSSPDSWKEWGIERHAASAPRWLWRIDANGGSKHFGCLQLKSDKTDWSYIHGDYDLKDVIVLGHERENRIKGDTRGMIRSPEQARADDQLKRGNRLVLSKLDGDRLTESRAMTNFVPLLPGMEFETIQGELNNRIRSDMVQHGSDAQFAWHGDESIIVVYPHKPELQFKILASAESVQGWYLEMNRKVLANPKEGQDYLKNSSRWFYFGSSGDMFLPGGLPSKTWG